MILLSPIWEIQRSGRNDRESLPQSLGLVFSEPTETMMSDLGGRVCSFPLSFRVADRVPVYRGIKTTGGYRRRVSYCGRQELKQLGKRRDIP